MCHCNRRLLYRLSVDVYVDCGLLAECVLRHARQEVPHNQLVHARLVPAEGVGVRLLGGVYGRVGLVRLAPLPRRRPAVLEAIV